MFPIADGPTRKDAEILGNYAKLSVVDRRLDARLRKNSGSGPQLGSVVALIEFPRIECQLAESRYIEEESAPSDAVQIGTTWKRANKDGSRDRRFNDNYEIPVMRYGALAFSSTTGLAEVYQISSYEKAAAFAQAVAAHKHALDNLYTPDDLPALPAPTDPEGDDGVDEPRQEPAFVAKPRKNLAVDWILLAILVIGLAVGTRWIVQNQQRARLSPAVQTSVAASSVAPPTRSALRLRAGASAHMHLNKGRYHKSRRHHTE